MLLLFYFGSWYFYSFIDDIDITLFNAAFTLCCRTVLCVTRLWSLMIVAVTVVTDTDAAASDALSSEDDSWKRLS